jgi:TonB family protein
MVPTLALLAALALQAGVGSPGRQAEAQGSLMGLFRPDDYPRGAAERGAQGTVGARLVVGRDGSVRSCSVTRSSGDAELDVATCTILQARARYQPARDRRGRAVADTADVSITWRLTETGEGTPFMPHRIVSSIAGSRDGSLSCWGEVDGTRGGEQTGENCARYGPPLAAGVAEQLMVMTFTPAEATAASGPAPRGIQAGEAEVELEILPDGSVGVCRLIRQNGRLGRPNLCTRLPPLFRNFQPWEHESNRKGRLRIILYETQGQ